MFVGAPTECEYCHGDLAAEVTTPDHTSNGWLDGCEECHSAVGWIPSHFPHPQFPLSGPHRVSCDSCHTTPGDYTTFSCTTGCHSKSRTDSEHGGVGGYVYDDDACYDCHRNGKGDD